MHVRNNEPDPFNLAAELSKAFAMYRQDNFLGAKEKYESILAKVPHNDAAIVGLKLCNKQLAPKPVRWKPFAAAVLVAALIFALGQFLINWSDTGEAKMIAAKVIEQQDWQQATTAHNVKGYQAFLNMHSESSYAKMAEARIQELQNNAEEKELQSFSEGLLSTPLKMIAVKGGTFYMGCTNEQAPMCPTDLQPQHQVFVDDFHLAQFEITQSQWKAVMGKNPSSFKDCDNCPVENVSWLQVNEFIEKLNQKTQKSYRLPTEAEWEFAARGGIKSLNSLYAGGDRLTQLGNFCDTNCSLPWKDDQQNDQANTTVPVGEYQPNELGFYDMSGNVWEWCSDWYDTQSAKVTYNPTGPESGRTKVLRGGSWNSKAGYCQVTGRFQHEPDKSFGYLGFRLAHSAK